MLAKGSPNSGPTWASRFITHPGLAAPVLLTLSTGSKHSAETRAAQTPAYDMPAHRRAWPVCGLPCLPSHKPAEASLVYTAGVWAVSKAQAGCGVNRMVWACRSCQALETRELLLNWA